jgi:hypothetical protein
MFGISMGASRNDVRQAEGGLQFTGESLHCRQVYVVARQRF